MCASVLWYAMVVSVHNRHNAHTEATEQFRSYGVFSSRVKFCKIPQNCGDEPHFGVQHLCMLTLLSFLAISSLTFVPVNRFMNVCLEPSNNCNNSKSQLSHSRQTTRKCWPCTFGHKTKISCTPKWQLACDLWRKRWLCHCSTSMPLVKRLCWRGTSVELGYQN